MEKNVRFNLNKKSLNIKEISAGAYINAQKISSDEHAFQRAIEKSFLELANEENLEDEKKIPLKNKPLTVEIEFILKKIRS